MSEEKKAALEDWAAANGRAMAREAAMIIKRELQAGGKGGAE